MNPVALHAVASPKSAVPVLYAVVLMKSVVLAYAVNPIKCARAGNAYVQRGLSRVAVHVVTASLKSAWMGSAETRFARAVLGNAARLWIAVS